MRHVIEMRDAGQEAVRKHPFFKWLSDDRIPAQDQLAIGPAGALFIMQFRDMNRWVLRFPEPHTEFEWVINLGTLEDEKHSRMFLEDWRKLDLDARLGWRTSDMLWWLFLSPDQEAFRRSGIDFIRLVVDDGDDALIRFGHSEAGEATGHVMLSNTARVAARLSGQTGIEYRYFGPYHLDLESGHVGNTEGIFESVTLDSVRRERASEACRRMFGIFDRIFDGFLHYAKTYLEAGTVPRRPPLADVSRENWTAPSLVVVAQDRFDADLLALIDERKERLRHHPFYEWLRSDERSPADKLRQFIPMWVMDILGYRDLTKYAMMFPDAATSAEQAVNAWASRLSEHSGLFLSDWDALRLDDTLGHSGSGALEWLFFDSDMDLHRQNMIEFAKIALQHDDALLRWWMLVALESTGEEFFVGTRPLALAAEAETGGRLDYLAGRHDPPGTGAADVVHLLAPGPLTAEQLAVAKSITTHVFDSMERQLWRSHAIVRAGKYATLALPA